MGDEYINKAEGNAQVGAQIGSVSGGAQIGGTRSGATYAPEYAMVMDRLDDFVRRVEAARTLELLSAEEADSILVEVEEVKSAANCNDKGRMTRVLKGMRELLPDTAGLLTSVAAIITAIGAGR